MIGNAPPSSTSSPDRPSPGRLIVISGPGGVGKSTIVAELRRRLPFHFSVSVTTRPPRPAEIEAYHYRFVGREEFEALAAGGDLMEWASFNGHLYGTPRDAVEAALSEGRDVVLEIEVKGAGQVREVRPDALMVFVRPPSLDTLAQRLRLRADTSEEDIEAKLRIARAEMAAAPNLFDHIVVNRAVEQSAAEIEQLLARRRLT